MYNTQLPRGHFWSTAYPDMEDYILGLPIPIGWGTIKDIVPFCIDTGDLRFKILDRQIEEITEIRSKGIPLSAGSYTEDLALAEFELKGTPYIVEGNTYYFAVSGDYAINGADYLRPYLATQEGGHQAYYVDGAGNWSAIANRELLFIIYGKLKLDLEEQLIHASLGIPLSVGALRDAAGHTKIGCSFTAPDAPRGSIWYVTKIAVFFVAPAAGAPTGNIWCTLYSAIAPEAQQGMQGEAIEIVDPNAGRFDLPFSQDGEGSDLLCDIKAPYPLMTTGAEILEDMLVSILDKPAAILNAGYLADFAAKRPQELKVFIDRDMVVGDFIGKLEASLLWRFLPLQDGTYGTIVFGPGTPAGTPHYMDIDYIEGSFRMESDLSTVRNIVRVKYDENPATQDFRFAETVSDYARLFYSKEDAVEVETWLRHSEDGVDLSANYSYILDRPEIRVTFQLHALGLQLLPGRDKVILTRERAAWPGGALVGKLFRIMKISKRPGTDVVEITAVPDERTYGPEIPESISISVESASAAPFSLGIVEEGTPGSGLHHVQLADADTLAQIDDYPLPAGTGDYQSHDPYGICSDGTYFYVVDSGNHRIIKFRISDGLLIWMVGSYGAGDDQFKTPWDICCDGTYIYISDRANYRIVKRMASTGAFVSKAGSYSSAPGDFAQQPMAITTDGEYVWVFSRYPHIQMFTCAGLAYVARVVSDATLTANGFNPSGGACVHGNFLYMTNPNNNGNLSIFKYNKGAMTHVASYGTWGTGNTNFKIPSGITTDGTYLYINDSANSRTKKHLLSDFSYVAETGGILQGNGLCLVEP